MLKKSEKFNASIMEKSKKETSMNILKINIVLFYTATFFTALKNYSLEVNRNAKNNS